MVVWWKKVRKGRERAIAEGSSCGPRVLAWWAR
jgi:hypothetical protein